MYYLAQSHGKGKSTHERLDGRWAICRNNKKTVRVTGGMEANPNHISFALE